MLRLLFWIAVLAAVVYVLGDDVPIPGIADQELVYTTTPPVTSCSASGCVAVYTLEIANVGRSAQPSVRVRLRADAVASSIVPPTLRRRSEVVAVSATEDRAGIDAYPLGALEPEERVALVFATRAASREAVPSWDRVLVGVDPGDGSARPGDVGAITVGRVVNDAARIAKRIVAAVRQAIASH
jgi:hypothetical protein